MQYHSEEYLEYYKEFCRFFWIAHGRSKHLQVWSFNSTKDLKPYLENIAGLDVKSFLETRKMTLNGVNLYLDSGKSRIKSGFREGNIFLPLTSIPEVFTKITENPRSDTFYTPHSEDELARYLNHFPRSKRL